MGNLSSVLCQADCWKRLWGWKSELCEVDKRCRAAGGCGCVFAKLVGFRLVSTDADVLNEYRN